MAWTDQCKIQACAQVDHRKKTDDISARKAIRDLSKESGIPVRTIERWYWPGDDNAKNGVKPDPVKRTGDHNHTWRKIVKRLDTLSDVIQKTAIYPPDISDITRQEVERAIDNLLRYFEEVVVWRMPR